MIGTEANGVAGLLLLALKGGVILSVTALAACVLHRASAAARHSVWFLGMVGLLVLPVAALTAPRWVVAVPAAMADVLPSVVVKGSALATPATSPSQGPSDLWNGVALLTTSVASLEAAAPPAEPMLSRLVALVFALWIAGAALLLLTFVVGLLTLAYLQRRSPRFTEGRVSDLARALALEMGIRGSVPVLRGMPGVMPMSWGLFRRVILLPEGAETWDETRLAAVLRHELAHVRRRDCLTQAVAEVSLALHWPNPLAWLAARRLRVEREHACDDAVVLAGARPSEYALALIELAESSRALPAPVRLAAAMARPVQLRWRLRAILDEERPRRGSPLGHFATAALTIALVVAVAAFTPAVVPASVELVEQATVQPQRDVTVTAPTAAVTDGARVYVAGPVAPSQQTPPLKALDRAQELVRGINRPAAEVRATSELAQIRGRITDAVTGAPLRDARVTRAGSEVVGISSESGSYALIEIPAGTHELRVERVGYATQTRTVALTADATLETDFALAPDGNAQFQAELNRLRATYSTTPRTSPADTPRVVLRPNPGQRSVTDTAAANPFVSLFDVEPDKRPIIFIDGVRVENEATLRAIDQTRIEKVEVIKGAGAISLFGVDAANGVIQIFLKPEPEPVVSARDRAQALVQELRELASVQATVPSMDSLANANTTRIRLRGESSISTITPLLFIDGVPVDDVAERRRVLANLDQNEIERIEVIKGSAAAARYGEAAAISGVILIYRKRP